MPILELRVFEPRCDHCKRYGGRYYDRQKPEDALPYGWYIVEEVDPIRGTDLVRKWESVLCPDCFEKTGKKTP